MAGGPSDRERISALEEHVRLHADELQRQRHKTHNHASRIQANANDLAVFKARLVGLAVGFGAAAGVIAALLVRLVLGARS